MTYASVVSWAKVVCPFGSLLVSWAPASSLVNVDIRSWPVLFIHCPTAARYGPWVPKAALWPAAGALLGVAVELKVYVVNEI